MKGESLSDGDLFRLVGNSSIWSFWRRLYSDHGFRFIYFFRNSRHYSRKSLRGFLFYFFYKKFSIKYNIHIPRSVELGRGFMILHYGGQVIHSKSVIGKNCNMLQGVTIGNIKTGKKKGVPVLGNEVYLGPNAVIVGNIRIGDNVLIAPNALVNFDVPSNSLVIGNPAKIIHKHDATEEYINNKV